MFTPQEHFDASRQFQAYFDDALRKVGVRAPQPVLGQSVNDYRRETCRMLKRQFLPEAHELYKVNYRGLRADVLKALEPQLLAACVEAANDASTVEPGQLRKIEEHDEYGALKMIKFVGPVSFVRGMMRPGRRVISFTTDRGRFDASGRALR